MRPPQRSRASTIVTPLPARASSRAAISPAAPAPTIRKSVNCRGAMMHKDRPRQCCRGLLGGKNEARPSVQTVEPHRAAGQYLAPGFGGQWSDPLADHIRRTGEKAILMRIIGCPHDLVRADIVGQHSYAVLDRLERDPAIALEEFARP